MSFGEVFIDFLVTVVNVLPYLPNLITWSLGCFLMVWVVRLVLEIF